MLFPLDEICPPPVQIPVSKPDPDRANPKIGVSALAFSSDSRYLATKNGEHSQKCFTWTCIFDACKLYFLDKILHYTFLITCFWFSGSDPWLQELRVPQWFISVSLTADNMASAVWVWDMQKMTLQAVLEQTSAVRCFQWDPRRPRLALCTGNTKLYLWSPAGCVSVRVPTEGNKLKSLLHMNWHSEAQGLIYIEDSHVPQSGKLSLSAVLSL